MKIAPGIFRAVSHNEVVYALDCSGAYVLVDVGSAIGLAEKLSQLVADGVDTGKIVALLVTHSHLDHAGAVPKLRAEHPLRVVAHRLASDIFRSLPAYTPLDKSYVDYSVDDGDTIEIGDLVFQVIHLPGHTPDSIAWQLGHSLFLGDILRCDGAIGWMDAHWGSCVTDYKSSLKRLAQLDIDTIYPGHGECGPFHKETVGEALRRLDALATADGDLLHSLGRPASRRPTDVPRKIVRLPTSLASIS